MADRSHEQDPDASSISFELGDIFNSESIISNKMTETEVPDNVVASLLDDV